MDGIIIVVLGALLARTTPPPELLWFVPLLFLVIRPVGVLLGLMGSALAARALREVIWNVSPWDPLSFAAVATLLGVDASGCVAIEDSPTGVGSAVAAGVPTIGVPHIVPIPPREGLVLVESLHGVGARDLWTLVTASLGERRSRPSPRPA